MWTIYRAALRQVSHFGPQEWLLSLLAVLVVGAICLRGFGSRAKY